VSEVKWIKLTTTMFDDEKIKLIESMPDADSLLIVWIKLLCQAGKTNASGHLILSEQIPYTDEMLSTLFNRPLNTVRLALDTLKQMGMIYSNGNNLCITNWSKYQNDEALQKLKNRERVARFREKQKLLTDGNDLKEDIDKDIDIEGNVTVILQNITKKQYAPSVTMTEEQYQKLVDKFGKTDADDRIETLSLYKQSKGKRYKCDYSTVLAWARKDGKDKSFVPLEHRNL
jgi:predicted phage replisome organizer